MTETLVPTNGPAALALASELGAVLTSTGLEIDNPNLAYGDWENIGRGISFAGSAWQWWVGDWITIGETLFGEEAAQAVDDTPSKYDVMRRVTGVEHQTLLNVASVSRRVARERRRPELRFSHHAVVAPFDPDDQEKWLAAAVENQWSVAELREAIREDKNPSEPDPVPSLPAADGPTQAERLDEAVRLLRSSRQELADGGFWTSAAGWVQVDSVLGES